MAYSFSLRDPGIEPALRRIADEVIGTAISGLDQTRPPPTSIHAARKSVKKLRGLIRLVRPAFSAYDTENAALRAAGMAIGTLRNAAVMLAVFDSLKDSGEPDAETMASLRALFVQRHLHTEDPAALAHSLMTFAEAMREVQTRAAKWQVKGHGFAALQDGLERTFSAAQKAMRPVIHSPSDPAPDLIHVLRKRVKDHWYQCRLLSPIWPEMMDPRCTAADTLGVLLGDHHDLSELIRLLPQGPASAPLIATAIARQRTLLTQALPLSQRLLAGPAHALTAQWQGWWNIWRDQRP